MSSASVTFLCPHPLSDALREVQKYSGPQPMQDAKVNPTVYDHVHMKLFRSQRNLYISGFSLFLWLFVSFVSFRITESCLWDFKFSSNCPFTHNSISEFLSLSYLPFLIFPVLWTHPSIMRRVVTLLNQVAVTLETTAGLQAQMDNAVKASKQHQEDNLTLKQVSLNLFLPFSSTVVYPAPFVLHNCVFKMFVTNVPLLKCVDLTAKQCNSLLLNNWSRRALIFLKHEKNNCKKKHRVAQYSLSNATQVSGCPNWDFPVVSLHTSHDFPSTLRR